MKAGPGIAALLGIVGLMLGMPAHADSINLSLISPVQYTTTGGTYSFYANVSAPITNSGVENLNGDYFLVNLPATLDDSGYNSDFPFSLNPGDSYTDLLLFTITLPNGVKPGAYTGSFEITGGPTTSSSGVLATVSFDVGVTPEPSSLVLLGTGLVGLIAAGRSRRASALFQGA